MRLHNLTRMLRLAFAGASVVMAASAASADILITEVDPTGSSTSTYAADWFELTNTGASAVDISGWKMDDNSNAFANAVALRGLTSVNPGQSVIFIEGNTSGSNDATVQASFINAWFGGTAPAGFAIGGYGGSGVGLSSGGDAVNIFDGSGSLQAKVTFGSATSNVSFDNAAGLNDTTISLLSVVGTNGAFSNGSEIGSPGTIANVPEPATFALAGLSLLGLAVRRR